MKNNYVAIVNLFLKTTCRREIPTLDTGWEVKTLDQQWNV